MDELKISAANTKPVQKTTAIHSMLEILKINPQMKAITAKNR